MKDIQRLELQLYAIGTAGTLYEPEGTEEIGISHIGYANPRDATEIEHLFSIADDFGRYNHQTEVSSYVPPNNGDFVKRREEGKIMIIRYTDISDYLFGNSPESPPEVRLSWDEFIKMGRPQSLLVEFTRDRIGRPQDVVVVAPHPVHSK